MYPSLPVAVVLAMGMGLIAAISNESSYSSNEPDNQETYEPPTDPSEVMIAIHEVLIGSAPASGRERLRKLLREKLTSKIGDAWQIVFPVNVEGTPSFERLKEIASTIGEAYIVPVSVKKILAKGVPFAVIHIGFVNEIDAELPWEKDSEGYGGHAFTNRKKPSRETYGGIIDLIVNSIIASAVGTVTSMGVQDLVHSMGGERRLARIMRHYKKAEARGDAETMKRIRQKMTKSASRIQGRRVSWSEIQSLTGVEEK